MIKYCPTCETDKDIEEFDKKGRWHQHQCRLCQRKRQKEWYNGNKETVMERSVSRRVVMNEWLLEYKKTLKCSKCSEDRWYVLDHHHLDPSKKEGIVAHMTRNGWSIKRMQKEIDKCIVLCKNCHAEVHYLEKLDNKN